MWILCHFVEHYLHCKQRDFYDFWKYKILRIHKTENLTQTLLLVFTLRPLSTWVHTVSMWGHVCHQHEAVAGCCPWIQAVCFHSTDFTYLSKGKHSSLGRKALVYNRKKIKLQSIFTIKSSLSKRNPQTDFRSFKDSSWTRNPVQVHLGGTLEGIYMNSKNSICDFFLF